MIWVVGGVKEVEAGATELDAGVFQVNADVTAVEEGEEFPLLSPRSGRTLHEQSVHLEHAPIVMTLLWAHVG